MKLISQLYGFLNISYNRGWESKKLQRSGWRCQPLKRCCIDFFLEELFSPKVAVEEKKCMFFTTLGWILYSLQFLILKGTAIFCPT